jgi:hypothetical protein
MEAIKVGQRFRETSFPHRTWEVVRVLEPIPGLPHARLRLLEDAASAKLISCLALRNGVHFEKIASQALDAAE